MRIFIAASLVAAGLVASSTAADACSIRGRYCGYPLWAANAFEGPFGSVNPNSGPIIQEVQRPSASTKRNRATARQSTATR